MTISVGGCSNVYSRNRTPVVRNILRAMKSPFTHRRASRRYIEALTPPFNRYELLRKSMILLATNFCGHKRYQAATVTCRKFRRIG
jgi:hypothetical protein